MATRPRIDFVAIKQAAPIVKVAQLLNLDLKRDTGGFRCPCTSGRGNDRAIKITPGYQNKDGTLGAFYCHGCKASGDCIALYTATIGMTFTRAQQKEHREAFIKDCRQRAWAAACRAEWIGKQLDKLVEDYTKLKAEDEKLEGEIKTLETAVDYHTVENRNKRKALQERRNVITGQMKTLGHDVQQGQLGANELYQSIEASLQLAAHAETWEWKEVKTD